MAILCVYVVSALVQQPRKKGKQKTSPTAGKESVAKRIRRNKMEDEDEGTSSDQLVDMYIIIMLLLLYVCKHSSQESLDDFLKQEQLLLVRL